MFLDFHRPLISRRNISANRGREILAARWFAVPALFCAPYVTATVSVDGHIRGKLAQHEMSMSAANSNQRRARAVSAAGAAVQKNLVSDEIVAKARLHGSVRIIVQLRIAAGSDDSREQRIDAARQGLLGELAAVAHQVVRSFTAAPMIALEASYDALQVLNRSSYVLRVDDDGLAAPLSTQDPSAPTHNIVEGKR